MRHSILLVATLALLASTAGASTPTALGIARGTSPVVGGGRIAVAVPARVQRGALAAVTVTLPPEIAAVDGRILFAPRSAEVVGVATSGGGVGLRPVPFRGGASFGAYDLRRTAGRVRLQLVLDPRVSGPLGIRVVIDAASTRGGLRARPLGTDQGAALLIEGRGVGAAMPRAADGPVPVRAAMALRELTADGRFDRRDVDIARLEWTAVRERGNVCGAPRADANGDGCVDIVDVQATFAARGTRSTTSTSAGTAAARPSAVAPRATGEGSRTFVVTSAGDGADAAPGNGSCADANGGCTLRAALTEADYLRGDDRIEFDLPGSAPVVIQLGSRLPIIASRAGTVTIDGYTQPGAAPNTAEHGSTAVPGIELRGNGSAAREVGLRITSPGNTVRGLALSNLYRGIVLDGTDAHDNRVVGDWIGFTGSGGKPPSTGQYGIVVNVGAHDNRIGTPDPADRNVIGYMTGGIDLYGPGTDGNVVQNALLCIRPDGGPAACSTGVDHNFGPKGGLIGGDGTGERNVIGPTYLQGIELSHGWDPSLPYGTDTATTYQVNGNAIVGNWVGFRADGHYDAGYRSGLHASSSDNGQGINCYDGTNDNVIARNFVASVYDGIQVQSSNARRNVVRGNVIGESPRGEPAPLTRWGIIVRWSTRHDVIVNNTIRNATAGGIGLLRTNNRGAAQPPAYNVTISRNIVSDTAGLGIDLFGTQGPEANDAGDADKGANTLLNTPTVTYADTEIVRGTALKGATVEVFRANRAAGEHGLPVEYLADGIVGTDGRFAVPVAGLTVGDRVIATQTRADGTTSELSANVAVTAAPAPGEPLGADDFEREVPSGWGGADLGGDWTLAGGGFSVANGEGHIDAAAGATGEARLPTSMADVRVTGRVRLDRLPVAGSAYAYVLARATASNAYRGSIRVAPSGAVLVQIKKLVDRVESNVGPEVATGLLMAPDAWLRFRFEAVGDRLRFRTWEGGSAEPDTWNVAATDSSLGGKGATGLRVYTGRPVTNGPITFSLDGFDVRRG